MRDIHFKWGLGITDPPRWRRTWLPGKINLIHCWAYIRCLFQLICTRVQTHFVNDSYWRKELKTDFFDLERYKSFQHLCESINLIAAKICFRLFWHTRESISCLAFVQSEVVMEPRVCFVRAGRNSRNSLCWLYGPSQCCWSKHENEVCDFLCIFAILSVHWRDVVGYLLISSSNSTSGIGIHSIAIVIFLLFWHLWKHWRR